MREEIFQWILGVEGGYVDHKNDRGGETNYGITKKVLIYAHEQGIVTHENPRELTNEEAFDIYKELYFIKSKANLLPSPLDLVHVDLAINSGKRRAGKILQKTVNFFLDEDLVVDGILGSMTMSSVEEMLDLIPIEAVISRYLLLRCFFVCDIIEKDRTQRLFLNGWINRIQKLDKISSII